MTSSRSSTAGRAARDEQIGAPAARSSRSARSRRVTCAPITRTIRGIASEVEVGPEHGLPDRAVINCDNIITVPKADLDTEPVGRLDMGTRAMLDRALRYSLDIIY